jgi:hypothetical protein
MPVCIGALGAKEGVEQSIRALFIVVFRPDLGRKIKLTRGIRRVNLILCKKSINIEID